MASEDYIYKDEEYEEYEINKIKDELKVKKYLEGYKIA